MHWNNFFSIRKKNINESGVFIEVPQNFSILIDMPSLQHTANLFRRTYSLKMSVNSRLRAT